MKPSLEQRWSRAWLAFVLLVPGAYAQATEIIDTSVSSSSVINHSTIQLQGMVGLSEVGSEAAILDDIVETPWIVHVFANDLECLRLDLIKPSGFAEFEDDFQFQLVVISSYGVVYRSTGRSFADARPLVKVYPTVVGWYTVYVAHLVPLFGRAANRRFTLLYGRYSGDSANCANPTPGQSPY